MADFYYGGGLCSVVGDFRAVQIEYRGAIKITDKTEDSFVFLTNKNRIIIYPIGAGLLSELFEYVGEFKVLSVKGVDTNAEFLPVTIHKQIDFVENIYTNSEDAVINIEDMNTTYTHKERISNTLVHFTEKNNQLMADEYLSKEVVDKSVQTTASQTSSISTGTSY